MNNGLYHRPPPPHHPHRLQPAFPTTRRHQKRARNEDESSSNDGDEKWQSSFKRLRVEDQAVETPRQQTAGQPSSSECTPKDGYASVNSLLGRLHREHQLRRRAAEDVVQKQKSQLPEPPAPLSSWNGSPAGSPPKSYMRPARVIQLPSDSKLS